MHHVTQSMGRSVRRAARCADAETQLPAGQGAPGWTWTPGLSDPRVQARPPLLSCLPVPLSAENQQGRHARPHRSQGRRHSSPLHPGRRELCARPWSCKHSDAGDSGETAVPHGSSLRQVLVPWRGQPRTNGREHISPDVSPWAGAPTPGGRVSRPSACPPVRLSLSSHSQGPHRAPGSFL